MFGQVMPAKPRNTIWDVGWTYWEARSLLAGAAGQKVLPRGQSLNGEGQERAAQGGDGGARARGRHLHTWSQLCGKPETLTF